MSRRRGVLILAATALLGAGGGYAIATLTDEDSSPQPVEVTTPAGGDLAAGATGPSGPLPFEECNVVGENGGVGIIFIGPGAGSLCNHWVEKQPTATLWLKGRRSSVPIGPPTCDLVYRHQIGASVVVARDELLGGYDAEQACSLLLQNGWRQAPPGGFNPYGE